MLSGSVSTGLNVVSFMDRMDRMDGMDGMDRDAIRIISCYVRFFAGGVARSASGVRGRASRCT